MSVRGPAWGVGGRCGWGGGSGEGGGEGEAGVGDLLAGDEGACEPLEVAGGGLQQVLEVALGVAAIAMAAQAVGADELR